MDLLHHYGLKTLLLKHGSIVVLCMKDKKRNIENRGTFKRVCFEGVFRVERVSMKLLWLAVKHRRLHFEWILLWTQMDRKKMLFLIYCDYSNCFQCLPALPTSKLGAVFPQSLDSPAGPENFRNFFPH